MSIAYQPFDKMSLAELRAEQAHWDRLIEMAGSIGWSSAYRYVRECRDQCAAWADRREREECQPRALAS